MAEPPWPEGEKPQVVLDWSYMWCNRHLEPYRAKWPVGAAVAMVKLFQAAVALPAVIEAVNAADTADELGTALEAGLRRFAPVCCFVPHATLAAIYAETVPT